MPNDARFHEIAALSAPDLIDRYAVGVERFDPRVLKLDDAALDTAFLPDSEVTMPDGSRRPLGVWPVRVLLGHLADAEMVLVHRMRRVVGEDRPVLAYWDENAFIDSGLYAGPSRPIGAFIAAIYTLRKWHAEWLRTLAEAQWRRVALHSTDGEQTTRHIANYATWHLEHHNEFLHRKVERLSKA